MKLPSLRYAVPALWRLVVALVRRKPILLPEEEKQMRVEICAVCEHYLIDSGQCGRCTCFVEAKAALTTERCPEDYWPDGTA